MLPENLSNFIIIITTIVWAANFVLQFIVVGYHPDITLNGVFMGVVGGALALSRKKPGNGGGT